MFNNGLHTDTEQLYQPEGTYRYLKGGTLVDPEGPITSEGGTQFRFRFDAGLCPIGDVDLGNGETLVFLVGDENRSVIGLVTSQGFKTVVDDIFFEENNRLGFSLHAPITATSRRGVRDQSLVYWTDGLNPPRRCDLSLLPTVGTEFSLSNLLLFTEVDRVPSVNLQSVSLGGGRLRAGSYAYAIALVDEDNTQTNWLQISRPVYVGLNSPVNPQETEFGSPPPIEGERGPRNSGKSVTFTIGSIDPNYTRLRVAALYWSDNGNPQALEDPEVIILPDVYFRDAGVDYVSSEDPFSISFTHTGSEATISGDIQEILIPKVGYNTARTLTQLDDVLYLGGLASKGEDFGYQPYANAIQIETVNKTVTQNNFKNPVFLFNNGGFKRDEIYAFYLAFVLKDGRMTRAYHIPGREPHLEANEGRATGQVFVQEGAGSSGKKASGGVLVAAGTPSTGSAASGSARFLRSGAPAPTPTVYNYRIRFRREDQILFDSGVISILPNMTVDSFAFSVYSILSFSSVSNLFDIFIGETEGDPSLTFVGKVEGDSSLNGYYLEVTYPVTPRYIVTTIPTQGSQNPNSPMDNVGLDLVVGGVSRTFIVQGLIGLMSSNQVAIKIQETLLSSTWVSSNYTVEIVVESGGFRFVKLTAKTVGVDYNGTITITSTPDNYDKLTAFNLIGGRNSGVSFSEGVRIVATGSFGTHVVETDPIDHLESASSVAYKIADAIMSDTSDLWSEFLATVDGSTVNIKSNDPLPVYNGTVISIQTGSTGVVASGSIIRGGGLGDYVGERDLVDSLHPMWNEVNHIPEVRRFHIEGIPDDTGFAYWENKNETYPESSNSEIWTVDENGNGIKTGDTLAGKNVRHHHFAEYRFSKNTSYNNTTFQSSFRIEGIRLKNVQIPDEIKDQVVGYKVFYAERGFGNRTVLDQSMLTYSVLYNPDHWPSPEDTDAYQGTYTFTNKIPGYSPHVGETFEYDMLVSRSFGLLRNQQHLNISSLSFAKALFQTRGGIASLDGTPPILKEDVALIRKIAGASYIATDIETTNALGTSFLNPHMEEKVVINLENTVPVDSDVAFVPTYVWDLHQFVSDLYVSYDLQRLVGCGPVISNLASISPEIYGGDTYTTPFKTGVTRARPYDGDDADTNQDVADAETNPYLVWNHHSISGLDDEAWGAVENWFYESDFNMWYRHNGTAYWQDSNPSGFNPAVIRENDSEIPITEQYKNWLGFNGAFHIKDQVRSTSPASKTIPLPEKYPTRIIRSGGAIEGLDIDPFRQFKDQDFKDLPRHRGPIVALENIGNGLLCHMDRGLFVTRGRDELLVGDVRAYLGAGDIFSVEPEEPYASQRGHAGRQSATSGMVTPLGYVWVDNKAKKVFKLAEGLEEISSKGNTDLFADLLENKLSSFGLTEEAKIRPYFQTQVSYDPRLYRAIITHFDLNPTSRFTSIYKSEQLRFNDKVNQFEYLSFIGSETTGFAPSDPEQVWTLINWSDTSFFTQDSWTITFLLDRGVWEGFQHYSPDWMIWDENNLLSVKGDALYAHIQEDKGVVYGEKKGVDVTVVVNNDPLLDKNLQTVWIESEEAPADIRVKTNKSDSGIVDLRLYQNFDNRNFNTRRIRDTWHVSEVRDASNIPQNPRLPSWSYQGRISGKSFELSLRFPGVVGRVVSLIGAGILSLSGKR